MSTSMTGYPCPCCGYLVFLEPPGSYEICSICGWEDDISQLRFPLASGGANRQSLVEAQSAFGQRSQLREIDRRPYRDSTWRMLDNRRDNFEQVEPGVDYGSTYPSDSTSLYYWRSNYWRKAT